MKRRDFLTGTSAVVGSSVVAGCACKGLEVGQFQNCTQVTAPILVPESVRTRTQRTDLVIDVHAHIFNAHDVPIVEYFTRPVLHLSPSVATLVKILINITGFAAFLRLKAPCAVDEMKAICELIPPSATLRSNRIEAKMRDDIAVRKEAFAEGIEKYAQDTDFQNAYRNAQVGEMAGVRGFSSPSGKMEYEEILSHLNDTDPFTRFGVRSRVGGIWRFLFQLTSPRYENAFRLIDLYGNDDTYPVDAFVVSTLDYDFSLKPRRKSTPMLSQALLMQKIGELTNHRILPFIGYDPRRDEEDNGAAFRDVVTAIDEYDHAGVKLYPPMGFAAYGNSSLDGQTLCEWPEQTDYGMKLDGHLGNLYRWLISKNIPILAHANDSLGILETCQVNGSAEDWTLALRTFPGLTTCAGHFGGTQDAGLSERMKAFAASIQANPERNLFVDLSFLPEVFNADAEIGRAFAALLDAPTSNGTVADHVVFGSDWYMIAQDPSEVRYASDAARYFERVGGAALRNKIMRDNPARYLNLEGFGARMKNKQGGGVPHWLNKL